MVLIACLSPGVIESMYGEHVWKAVGTVHGTQKEPFKCLHLFYNKWSIPLHIPKWRPHLRTRSWSHIAGEAAQIRAGVSQVVIMIMIAEYMEFEKSLQKFTLSASSKLWKLVVTFIFLFDFFIMTTVSIISSLSCFYGNVSLLAYFISRKKLTRNYSRLWLLVVMYLIYSLTFTNVRLQII